MTGFTLLLAAGEGAHGFTLCSDATAVSGEFPESVWLQPAFPGSFDSSSHSLALAQDDKFYVMARQNDNRMDKQVLRYCSLKRFSKGQTTFALLFAKTIFEGTKNQDSNR